MYNKFRRKHILIITVAFLVMVAVFLFIGFNNNKSVFASALKFPSIGSQQEHNGVSIQFTSADRSGEIVRAEFCYQLPTSEDWQLGRRPDDVTLSTDKNTYVHSGGGLSVAEFPVNEKGQTRCSYALFNVPSDQELGEVTFTVTRLVTSLPEQFDCKNAQGKLDKSEKGKGITIKCRNTENSSGFDITSKPAGLSESNAAEIAIDEGFSSTLK